MFPYLRINENIMTKLRKVYKTAKEMQKNLSIEKKGKEL